ncbi:hypothetical protein ANO11243_045840 [Dothideomycetidae sp. 11243]|nr:hypothetical protein ANO11243_045840 [fungal sp. No.11243]
MQGAQLHSAAQPGFHSQPLDPRVQSQIAHLQMIQMMQERAIRQGMAPPEQAVKNIQTQIKSFYDAYPQYAGVDLSPQSRPTSSHMMMSSGASPMAMTATSPMMMPVTTPIMMQRAGTPPQSFLPTPPPTQKIPGGRTMRRIDTTPMPMNFSQVPVVHIQQPATHDMPLFQDGMGGEYTSYGSPSYAASVVSNVSPHMSPMKHDMNQQGFFEDSPMMPTPEMMSAQQQMMMAAAAASQGYYYPDSPLRVPMSPQEAMLAGLAADASIEDTGISAEEVASFISPQDAVDGKWTCMFPECNKKFGRKENIRSHVQTHLGDRQFRCNHCGKCFVRQHDLKRHAKIHSGDKPHKCPCGNGFARQDALTRHRQRGVCSGTLPGFERREVKRGRPRKNRPEAADRLEKSSRARKMDARRDSEDLDAYSSSSSPSDSGSDPYTPPHMGDLDLGSAEGVEAFIRAYSEHTPPTSPLTSGASHSSRQESFDVARATFDIAAASSHASSPRSHRSPNGTATFDFASPMTAVSPRQLQSAQTSPLMRQTQATGSPSSPAALSSGHHTVNTSPSLSNTVSTAASQSEPSLGENVFDWGAIESQPSLVGDSFSPAAASSPAHTDLFSDDLDLLDSRHEMFGTAGDGMFMKSMNGQVDSVFDLVDGDIEGWILGH